ncbi:MAG: hypothetical protein KF841_17150, partial [Phycisphaerae bacterium]|nr:hypothetical protein [Phycisphaerae bacterium]
QQFELPANHQYRIHYNLDVTTPSFVPIGHFNANGYLNLTFLPEPSALTMLLPAWLLFRRPSHAR